MGHASTQYYAIDVSASGTIVGGMQDNGISMAPDGEVDVAHHRDADTTVVVFDPSDERRCFAAEFGRISPCNNDGFFADVGRSYTRTANPMVIAPGNPSRLYASSMKVLRIENLQGVPMVTVIRAGDNVTHWSALAVDPSNADIVWVADDGGTISRTTNATSTSPAWTTAFTSTESLSADLPSTILIDRHNPQIVYVGATTGILKTDDGGTSWKSGNGTAADASLPPIPVRKIIEHPTEHGWLYAATPIGLFISADGGTRWLRAAGATVPGKLDIRDLVFRPKTITLYMATYGRHLVDASVGGIATATARRRALDRAPR